MRVTRVRGDTAPDTFSVTSVKTRSMANLTGCSFKLTVNSLENPPDATTQLFQVEGVIDDPASGIVTFTPTPEQANHVGFFFYDIQMTDTYGRDLTLMKDAYVFTQDITK